jgi:hypothetical protein
MTDALITSAISHWGPRFVANGVSLTDFEEVTASIAGWNDWCKAWSARAAIHEDMGREALAAGKHLSAGKHLQRAGVYYHFAKFLFVHDVAQMKAAHAAASRSLISFPQVSVSRSRSRVACSPASCASRRARDWAGRRARRCW